MNMNGQHKRILFMISLPQTAEFETCNEHVSGCINKLREKGVDVCESIHHEDLATISQYDIVIIVAHHDTDDDALLLADGKLSMDDFVNSIPEDFCGELDFSSCYSASVMKGIKDRCPNCHIQASIHQTTLALRLLAYPYVIDIVNEDNNIEYHDAYMKVLDMMLEAATEIPEVEDIELVKLGQKYTSVFMPEKVTRGEFFKLQIKMHLDIDTGTLYFEDAKGNDPNTAQRKKNVAIKNIQIGDELLLNLFFLDGDRGPIPTEQIKIEEELKNNDNIYTMRIPISKEDQTLVLHIKITNEYTYSKFFTIIKFLKDGKHLIEPFDLETEFKSGNSHSVSNIDRPDASWGNQYKPGRIVEQFKAGRPFGSLFREDDDKEKWAKIFTDFLKKHDSQHDFTIKANKQDYISMAFGSFYIRWLQIKIKKDGKEKSIVFEDQRPNGPACFRFLTEDCGIKYSIKSKNPINQYGNFIRDEIVDRTAGKKSSFKEIRNKTKEVEEEVSNWFSEHKLNN